MNKVQIKVTKQLDGYNFGLDPLEKRAIVNEFPKAKPLAPIFVAFDRNGNVEFLFDRVSKFIFPALIGVEERKELNKIKQLEFIEAATDKVIKTVEYHA